MVSLWSTVSGRATASKLLFHRERSEEGEDGCCLLFMEKLVKLGIWRNVQLLLLKSKHEGKQSTFKN